MVESAKSKGTGFKAATLDNSNISSIAYQSPNTNEKLGFTSELHPHQQQAKESSIVLKSTLKGLKDNYQ
jgi:hypothetical protein